MLDSQNVKPFIPVDLLCADTTRKSHLAERAISQCLKHANFASVKLLTDNPLLDNAVMIPPLKGLDGYSNFCITQMAKHVTASHVLVVQSDGYIVDASKWTDEFLRYDYIGAPYQPSNTVGNGGFSLRSKKLLDILARTQWPTNHPEDAAICIAHRAELEAQGIRIAPVEVARRFSFEGRSWDGAEWKGVPNAYTNSFGFHSWLSVLPKMFDRPKVFHHSGDAGDIIYSLATIKALGGGVLFLSCDNKYPYPMTSRWCRSGGGPEFYDNISGLLEEQDYVWSAKYTHGTPFSTDFDLNRFRESWGTKKPDMDSIYQLHAKAYAVHLDNSPWLKVREPISFPNFPIICHRTPRYRNDDFPWAKLCEKYQGQIMFVGTEDEHLNFSGFVAPKQIPHFKTKNLLHLARVIAGAKVFIGNQSSPLSIALGLGKNVIVEEWPLNPNCRVKRDNAIYVLKGDVDIPKEWL